MRNKFMKITTAFVWIGAGALFVSPLFAEEKPKLLPDASRGKTTVERLCVSCHIVSESTSARVTAGVPTFNVIANRKKQTAERIRGILISPHKPMPDVQLTRVEIEDIIAYLDSIRDANSGPPLLPDVKKPAEKPELPEHS
jgi:cytochrome c